MINVTDMTIISVKSFSFLCFLKSYLSTYYDYLTINIILTKVLPLQAAVEINSRSVSKAE